MESRAALFTWASPPITTSIINKGDSMKPILPGGRESLDLDLCGLIADPSGGAGPVLTGSPPVWRECILYCTWKG